MKYTLDTKILFMLSLGRWKEEETKTLEELGFTQEMLDKSPADDIEADLQEMHEEWEQNFLDSGWSVID
ncbi:hypothetical protein [Salimicrobium halophilum]|uniref:Uncharacterized protein n=1 Tax=Salimicrobium halophilum TaxID=86666 RepID=A0A1G8WG29_9BACI|nr:hypothetical protein [Salimicrobium halophilum]SDJ76645.1 hypothetical protein SAMN04490247_3154 [Salimicrobium halophilum]